jgi:hypothetical protein
MVTLAIGNGNGHGHGNGHGYGLLMSFLRSTPRANPGPRTLTEKKR